MSSGRATEIAPMIWNGSFVSSRIVKNAIKNTSSVPVDLKIATENSLERDI